MEADAVSDTCVACGGPLSFRIRQGPAKLRVGYCPECEGGKKARGLY